MELKRFEMFIMIGHGALKSLVKPSTTSHHSEY
jgi:hypothetical protein